MGPSHLDRVHALGGAARSQLLSCYASRGASEAAISDLFGGDLTIYRHTFAELEALVTAALDRATASR